MIKGYNCRSVYKASLQEYYNILLTYIHLMLTVETETLHLYHLHITNYRSSIGVGQDVSVNNGRIISKKHL